jgi:murein DD-endopeptidase MepM/ murein hydrolase activator NlpD
MDHVTLIVVPEAHARVRRLRVPRALVRFGPVSLLGFVLAFGALGADWVRLRLEAVDVAGLRARALDDQAALAGLAVQLRSLEARLGRVAEFERKVRIVADLPETAPLPAVGKQSGATPPAAPTGGQGGEGDPAGESAEGAPTAPVSAPPDAALGAPPESPPAALPGPGLDGAVLQRVRARAERLLARATRLDRSLAALVAALGRQRERLAATPSIAPVRGWITSAFGWRRSPFTGRRQLHRGLDIAATPGSDFVATARGRVIFAGVRGSFGRTVVVDHGHGLETTYGHAAALHVRAGQQVERGQRLGAVGSSGRSTGPHVHYAVELRGRAVDPADYLLD